MAIGWLTVLQIVPWADVVKNAPAVADSAKKLWNAITKKSTSQEAAAPSGQPALTLEAQAIATLQAQLSELHDQMLASSELIKALAEQNTQLIHRIEANRVRVLWLSIATAVIGMVAISSLILTLIR